MAQTDEKMRTDGPSSPAVQYVETILVTLDHIEQNLPLIIQSAEQTAGLLMAGGDLYAAPEGLVRDVEWPPEFGFPAEACGRAGGMMMIRTPQSTSALGDQDVVLAGTLNLRPDEQGRQLRAMRDAGALVILFGSAQSPVKNEADILISTGLSAGTASVVTGNSWAEPICPAGPVGNIAGLWVFTGELVAACTRQGKMPSMYQSIFVPGNQDRNARYSPYAFHEDMTIAPVPPEQAGRTYLAEIRRCFQGLREHQIPAFQIGGRKIADAVKTGYKAWGAVLGHHLPYQFGMPGDPEILDSSIRTAGVNTILKTIGPKDALVYVGYYDFPEEDWQPLREIGVPSIWITGGRESRPVTSQPWEIHVDPYWTYGDACVEIVGYDVKILPPSGVIQTAALWMIIGEIAGALSGET